MKKNITTATEFEYDGFIDASIYKDLVAESPIAYAYHEMIYDDNGKACNYRFLEVNHAFETYTGLNGDEIIGKTVLDVMPDIIEHDFNWIDYYANVVQSRETKTIHQYSHYLHRDYEVRAFSPKEGSFVTLFSELTGEGYFAHNMIDLFHMHFLQSDFGVVLADGNFNIIDTNRQMAVLCGKPEKDLLEHPILDMISSENKAIGERFLKELEQNSVGAIEGKIYRPDGTYTWGYLFAVKLTDRNQYIFFMHDISKQREAEEKLSYTESVLKASIESSKDILIFALDLQGRYILFNEAHKMNMYSLTGKYPEIGNKFMDYIFPENLEATQQLLDDVLGGESRTTLRTLGPNKLVLDSTYNPIRDTQGNIIGISSYSKDITEHVKEHEKTKQSESRFRSLFENMTSGAVIYEVINDGSTADDYIIKGLNTAGAKEELRSIEKIRGMTLAQIRPGVDDFGIIPVLQRVWKTGISEEIPPSHYVDERTDAWYVNNIFKLDSGEVVAVYDDITEQVEMRQELIRSEAKYRTITENTADVLWTMSLDLTFDYISPSVRTVFDIDPDNIIGQHLSEVVNPEAFREITYFINEKIRNDRRNNDFSPDTFEFMEPFADGRLITIESTINFLQNKESKIIGIIGVSRNINERKALENAIEDSRVALRLLLDSTAEGIFGLNESHCCTYANRKCVSMLGLQNENQILGKHYLDIINNGDDPAEHPLSKVYQGEPVHLEYHKFRRNDGTELPVECYAYPQYRNGRIQGAVITFFDISERLQNEEEIRYLNYHDILTGLYNRAYFERSKRVMDETSNLPLTFMIGDINGLKMVNDAFGNNVGDKQIIETAKILKDHIRETDVLARIGGDEFAILMPQTDLQTANEIASNIQQACNQHNTNKHDMFYVNISLGLETKTDLNQTLDQIMSKAEENMYRHKMLVRDSLHSRIVDAMKTTLYEKSEETEKHAARMIHYAKLIANELELPIDQIYDLELLATLHDIGKIGVDDRILKKPGRLTEDEKKVIQMHSEIGYRIAMASPELKSIAEYILTHHERWDGKGYPEGIAGTKIPLLSRIIAVVDAYDAMTEDRIYRKAISKKEAMKELRDNAGTQFDPQITAIFLRLLKTKEIA